MKKTLLFCLAVLGSLSAFADATESQTNVADQITAIANGAQQNHSCQGVMLYINCFGDQACHEAGRQKKDIKQSFTVAGVTIFALLDYYRETTHQVEYKGKLHTVDNSRIKSLTRPTLTYEGERVEACALSLRAALNISAKAGPKSHGTDIIINKTENQTKGSWLGERLDSL